VAGQVELRPTTGPGTAPAIAAEAFREGFELIVAAGGDGTISEVADGLAQTQDGLARCRVGLIPLGTVNVFAKELGLPGGLADAWRAIQSGRETKVDLPWVEFTENGKSRRRRFVQLAGAGLDSRSVALVNWKLKKLVGPLAYVWAGLAAIRGPQPQIRVRAGDREAAGELVLIGNGRFYGGRIPMFPQADRLDGLLEVRVFHRANWVALARFGSHWLRCRSSPPAGETWLRAATVELHCDQEMPLELDGDNIGHLPVRFGVDREALRVVGPRPTAARTSTVCT
jgi:YegS/Rv2252/BmrU family lipid kinase